MMTRAEKGTNVMRPKSKGSGIMISDFIEGKGGYLALMQEQYDLLNDPSTKMYARQLLEYGESKEGYWTSDKFMIQIKQAVKIVQLKYPKTEGFSIPSIFSLRIFTTSFCVIMWSFDQSRSHFHKL